MSTVEISHRHGHPCRIIAQESAQPFQATKMVGFDGSFTDAKHRRDRACQQSLT